MKKSSKTIVKKNKKRYKAILISVITAVVFLGFYQNDKTVSKANHFMHSSAVLNDEECIEFSSKEEQDEFLQKNTISKVYYNETWYDAGTTIEDKNFTTNKTIKSIRLSDNKLVKLFVSSEDMWNCTADDTNDSVLEKKHYKTGYHYERMQFIVNGKSVFNVEYPYEYDENHDILKAKLDPDNKLKKATLANCMERFQYSNNVNLKTMVRKKYRKNLKFESLNKRLFTIKNNKEVIKSIADDDKRYGAGYIQVYSNNEKIAKILVVWTPSDSYGFDPRVTKMKKINKNTFKLKLYYPPKKLAKKLDVTNIKDYKLRYRVEIAYESGRDDYDFGHIESVKSKFITMKIDKNVSGIGVSYSSNYILRKDKNGNVLEYFNPAYPDVEGMFSSTFGKNAKYLNKMKKNKWYNIRQLSKLGISIGTIYNLS